MNLAKKYKQLFEGKSRSNDFILLNESVDKYFSIIKGDKLINSKGLSNVEKTGPKELKMTFKSKVNKNWDSLDIINHLLCLISSILCIVYYILHIMYYIL